MSTELDKKDSSERKFPHLQTFLKNNLFSREITECLSESFFEKNAKLLFENLQNGDCFDHEYLSILKNSIKMKLECTNRTLDDIAGEFRVNGMNAFFADGGTKPEWWLDCYCE